MNVCYCYHHQCHCCRYFRLPDGTYTALSTYREFMLFLLYFNGTNTQRSTPFWYLLYLLGQGHLGSHPCSLESSYTQRNTHTHICVCVCVYSLTVRGLFIKYLTFCRIKIHLHAWRSATLIPFKVVSLWLNTLLPAVPPLFEAFLECLFVNGLQLGRHVPYNVVSLLPFSCIFRWGNSQISQGAMWGEKGACRTTGMLCLAKKVWISCEEWAGALSWCRCHAPAAHRSGLLRRTASRKRRRTSRQYSLLMFWPCGAYSWCITPRESKKTVNISLTLLRSCLAFLASGMMNVSTVTTAPWFPGRTRKPTTHHQWPRCSGIRGRRLRSPACPGRLPDGVASVPSLAASARISRTLSAWPNHRSKWNVPNQCLFPSPPQVLGRRHDGPTWPKSALGPWARRFGLLRTYRNERRSPPTCGHLWIRCTTS